MMKRTLFGLLLLLASVLPTQAQDKFMGNYLPGATVAHEFNTFATNGTLGALVGGAVAVYKNSDTTEVTTGVTLTASFDGVTGVNHLAIVTTDAWYAADTPFTVVLSAGTVDSVSVVGYVVGKFTISGGITLRKNVAFTAFPFVMFNGVGTPTAGLTVTCTRVIDTGAFAACANSPAGIASGVYKVNLATTDLNGSAITFKFSAAGMKDTIIPIITQP